MSEHGAAKKQLNLFNLFNLFTQGAVGWRNKSTVLVPKGSLEQPLVFGKRPDGKKKKKTYLVEKSELQTLGCNFGLAEI